MLPALQDLPMLVSPPGTHKWFLGQVQHMGREQWFSMPLKVTSDSITTRLVNPVRFKSTMTNTFDMEIMKTYFTESGEIGECYWLQV